MLKCQTKESPAFSIYRTVSLSMICFLTKLLPLQVFLTLLRYDQYRIMTVFVNNHKLDCFKLCFDLFSVEEQQRILPVGDFEMYRYNGGRLIVRVIARFFGY